MPASPLEMFGEHILSWTMPSRAQKQTTDTQRKTMKFSLQSMLSSKRTQRGQPSQEKEAAPPGKASLGSNIQATPQGDGRAVPRIRGRGLGMGVNCKCTGVWDGCCLREARHGM